MPSGSCLDRQVGRGLDGRDRQLAEDDGVVHQGEPIEAFTGDDQGTLRVAVPQRDLGSERVQVDHVLGILDPDCRGPGDLEVTPCGRQVPGPDGQMGERDVQVDGADTRQRARNVALEQLGGLGIARQLDQHRGGVELEEDPEAQLAAIPSAALDAGERHLERLLHEPAHLEHAAEVRLGARDRDGIIGRAGQVDRTAQKVDAASDVAEGREIDAEDAHRPRLDALVAQRPGRGLSPVRRPAANRRTGRRA